MPRSLSLFARTGITLAIALAVFMLFTVASMVNFILIPLAKQGVRRCGTRRDGQFGNQRIAEGHGTDRHNLVCGRVSSC